MNPVVYFPKMLLLAENPVFKKYMLAYLKCRSYSNKQKMSNRRLFINLKTK